MSDEYFDFDRPDGVPGPGMQQQQQGQFPPGQFQPGQFPPGQFQPGQFPPGQFQPGQFPPGQFPPGQFPPGQFPPGQFPPGQFPPGQFPPGQFPPGQFPPTPYPQDEDYLAPYTPGQHFFGQYAPTMRPPFYIPRRPIRQPGPIRFCVNRFAYIWMQGRRDFWAWISFVSRRTIYGYRWNGRRWVYFQADINDIEAFICIR